MKRCWSTRVAAITCAGAALGLTVPLGGLGALGNAAAGAASGGTPINVGFICTCTGPLASSGEVYEPGFKAWVSYENSLGGINGHRIDATYVDDGDSPTEATTEIQHLLSANIDVLVDASAVDADWASTVEVAHIPIIGNSTSLIGLTSEDVFTPSQTIDSLPMAIALSAKKVGLKNYGLLYCAEDPTCQELVPLQRADAQKVGLDLVYTSAISASAPSYVAQCLAAEQAGAKGLFVGTAVQPAISAASDCVKQGYKPIFIGDDGAIANNFNKSPGWSHGMLGIQPNIPWFVNDTSGTKTMYAAWKKYQPDMLKSPNFNELAVEGWAFGLLIAAAVEGANVPKSQPVTTSDVLDGMYTIHNDTLGGIAPALTFNKGEPHLTDCWFLMRTENGKYTTPYGLRTFCLPPA